MFGFVKEGMWMQMVRGVNCGLPGGKRSLLLGISFVCMLTGLGVVTNALGQDSANDYIEPRVNRPQYESFIRHLSLARDQRNSAELVYGDYQTTLTELAQQTDESALKAGRQSVQDAFSGKSRVTPDELKRMRVEVLKTYEHVFPATDAALDQLVNGLHAMLTPEQEAAFAPALRELHRQIMLHPRQVGSQYEDYAGDGVDVLVLVEDARKAGGELAGLDPQALDPILAAYEAQLDAFLLETTAAYRRGRLMAKMAGVQKDIEGAAQERQAAVDRWKRLYQLNQMTVDSIATIVAESAGEGRRQAWLERFDAACFSWMYPRTKPDRQIEWIAKQTTVTAEQRQSARQIFDQYQSRRKQLNRQAIDLMLRARLEFQTMLYFMMDPTGMDEQFKRGLYEQLLKNSGEQASLDSTTTAALEGVLNETQRKAMREALKGPDPARRR